MRLWDCQFSTFSSGGRVPLGEKVILLMAMGFPLFIRLQKGKLFLSGPLEAFR